ncbi:MAG: hypothetical protein E7355_04880 [Clostridiales bacterium]|nr:hypothetical protein [Clostridiales bacterium]
MRTDRVILRSIFTTLLAVIVLFGIMLLTLFALFPSTMAKITYDIGLNESSVKYAERAYKRSDDVFYAAFAFETSILTEDSATIEKNGLSLLADDEFAEYCKARNEEIAANDKVSITYQQYVYGQVTMAQYSQGKITEAISTACQSLNGAFPKNNAAAILYLTALKGADEDTVTALTLKMEQLQADDLSNEDRQYLQALLSLGEA